MKRTMMLAATTLMLAGTALAQKPTPPVKDVSHHHPNLAAAQRMSENAYNKIVAAQQANEWDLQGHAQKAKELLDQVNAELKQAAQASNKEHGGGQ